MPYNKKLMNYQRKVSQQEQVIQQYLERIPEQATLIKQNKYHESEHKNLISIITQFFLN